MANLVAKSARLPAGGGSYALSELTLGVFLNDQPQHRFSVGSDRTVLSPLKKHQGWILPAGSQGICNYQEDLEFLSVSLDNEILSEVGFDPRSEFEPVIGAFNPLLLELCLGAERFLSGPMLYRETMQRALAAQLKASILPEELNDLPDCDNRLRRVLSYVKDELHTDLSLTKMASIAAMSPTSLSRSFKKELGVSPLQFVIAQRQEKAAFLLRSTQKSVAEIAAQVGYNDLGRFGQHFKRRFKMAPTDYRKQ